MSDKSEAKLRELYIGMAMQAFNANPQLTHWDAEKVTDSAIEQADSIIKRLRNESKEA